MDTAAAAAFLGLTRRTLEWWRITGRGPRFLKIGASVRYRITDLEAFERERERTSTSDTGAAAASG